MEKLEVGNIFVKQVWYDGCMCKKNLKSNALEVWDVVKCVREIVNKHEKVRKEKGMLILNKWYKVWRVTKLWKQDVCM